MNDYTIIGSVQNYNMNRFLPLERVYSDTSTSIRVSEVQDLKHQDETDIEFMESLYRNSNPDYYLGGWIVRAVVDILLEFTIGDLPTLQCTDKTYSKFCNTLWTNNQSKIYSSIKELGLFGQVFVYVGYDSIRKCPKFRTLTKANVVDIRYEDFNEPDEITYIRIREQFKQAKPISEDMLGEEQVEYEDVFYDKIFWKELNPKFREQDEITKKSKVPQKWIYKMKILKRVSNNPWTIFRQEENNPMNVIPVVEFNQNKLSFDNVGHSDLSGAMKIISVYHQVLEASINNTLYNSQPTLKFTGLDADPIDFVKQMYGDASLQSGDTLNMEGLYNVYGSYYLASGQDVNWLQAPTTAGVAKETLNLLFYILVQVTGVPEWVLGAGMEGAWATVKQQSVPLLQKIRSKRMDITDDLLKLNRVAFMVDQYHAITKTNVENFDCQIVWGDVLTNDLDTQLRLVEFMLQNHFITKETAVSILGMVNDPLGELKRAQKQYEKEQKQTQSENDNEGTIKALVEKRVNQNIEDNEEENDNEDEISGEMVSKVAMRVMHMLFDSPESA